MDVKIPQFESGTSELNNDVNSETSDTHTIKHQHNYKWTSNFMGRLARTKEECMGMCFMFQRTALFWHRIDILVTILIASMMIGTSLIGVTDPDCESSVRRWTSSTIALGSSLMLAVYRTLTPDCISTRSHAIAAGYRDLVDYIDELMLLSESDQSVSIMVILDHIKRRRKGLFEAEEIIVPFWIWNAANAQYQMPDYIRRISSPNTNRRVYNIPSSMRK